MSAWLVRVRAADPFWYRVCEVAVVIATLASHMLSAAIEDGIRRIAATRKH